LEYRLLHGQYTLSEDLKTTRFMYRCGVSPLLLGIDYTFDSRGQLKGVEIYGDMNHVEHAPLLNKKEAEDMYINALWLYSQYRYSQER